MDRQKGEASQVLVGRGVRKDLMLVPLVPPEMPKAATGADRRPMEDPMPQANAALSAGLAERRSMVGFMFIIRGKAITAEA